MIENDNDLQRIGKRLAELRKTLSEDSGTEWSQPRLSRELGVTQNLIARMEKGMGSIDKFVKVLLFYHDRGYNIAWVLVPDNQGVSKYRTADEPMAPKPDLVFAFEKLSKAIFGK